MAYIDTVPESQAEGKLADLYRRFANPDGSIDDVVRVHSVNPDALEAHLTLYVQAMHRPSPLDRIERELIAVAVSRVNQCHY